MSDLAKIGAMFVAFVAVLVFLGPGEAQIQRPEPGDPSAVVAEWPKLDTIDWRGHDLTEAAVAFAEIHNRSRPGDKKRVLEAWESVKQHFDATLVK